MKTQIRFSRTDVEVLVKTKGSNEPYKTKSLDELCPDGNIPEFDHTLKWLRKKGQNA